MNKFQKSYFKWTERRTDKHDPQDLPCGPVKFFVHEKCNLKATEFKVLESFKSNASLFVFHNTD